MDNYKIGEDGTIIFDNDRNIEETAMDKLQKEYSLLEYEVLNNHGHPTKDPEKLARYEKLKKILGIDEKAKKKAFLKAKHKILNDVGKTASVSQIVAMAKVKENE